MAAAHPATRRRVLRALGAGLAAAPFGRVRAAQDAVPRNPDVVVVGAGAAGLVAAAHLRRRGYAVALIEARGRPGGRAHTDTATFGVPFDRGCHWLHQGAHNRWLPYARDNGFAITPQSGRTRYYVQGRRASPAEAEDAWHAYTQLRDAMLRAGQQGQDVAASTVAPSVNAWDSYARNALGPWAMAKDLDAFSVLDWWGAESGSDYLCNRGYGALVAHYARRVPKALDTPARRIAWGGAGVRVETDRGTIRARAVVVTVSTGVLTGGGLAFDPPLPAPKRDAFAALPMGTLNHMGFLIPRSTQDIPADTWIYYKHTGREAAGMLANAGGTGLLYMITGGSFGRDLERDGEPAMLAWGREALGRNLGSAFAGGVVRSTATRWTADPVTLGAYASAKPGKAPLRDTLAEPVGERVFFAGEACHPLMWATCHGAAETGRTAAQKVAATLG